MEGLIRVESSRLGRKRHETQEMSMEVAKWLEAF